MYEFKLGVLEMLSAHPQSSRRRVLLGWQQSDDQRYYYIAGDFGDESTWVDFSHVNPDDFGHGLCENKQTEEGCTWVVTVGDDYLEICLVGYGHLSSWTIFGIPLNNIESLLFRGDYPP